MGSCYMARSLRQYQAHPQVLINAIEGGGSDLEDPCAMESNSGVCGNGVNGRDWCILVSAGYDAHVLDPLANL
ncbi:hypothetical protein F2Q69_00032940 [Brassica cretica]|uniref:Uncharacterized protein n=1 Tax=Brassica cretica TaxID=69181 RepID=A0A8S9SHF9_BRACR|nr:hypothetical protein F2Q69_00032940 [Brassica cretica]